MPALLPITKLQQPVAASRLGIAVCGGGPYARDWILPALLHHSTRCRLAGLIEADTQQARLLGRSLGLPADCLVGFEDMPQLASQDTIDAVYVASPTSLHPRHAIAALSAGKHVICRKPMAPSSGACRAMIEAARRQQRALVVDYQLHSESHIQALQRIVSQHTMGLTTHVRSLIGIQRTSVNDPDVRLDTAGPFPLMNLAVLGIQAACYGTGQVPVTVESAQITTMRPQIFGSLPDTMAWTLGFADGATASGEATFNRTQNQLRVEMQRGLVEMEPAFTMRGIQSRINGTPLAAAGATNLMAAFLDHVAQAIMTNTRPNTPGEMGLRDLVIMEAIFSAAIQNKRVAINLQQLPSSKTGRP